MDAIDTGILIWGVRKEVPAERPDIVDRCVWLIKDIASRSGDVMVPSIVLGEYLVGTPPEKRKAELALFRKHFFVAPFDTNAAEIAAEIYSKAKIAERKLKSQCCGMCIKADLKIIATAIAHGAGRIYTDNTDDFRALACGKIIVEHIPELPLTQKDLLG